MKTLLVMRHAESDPAAGGMDDHDRPINHQGRIDATRMGELLRDEGQLPERILSSTARRARQTAVAAADACGYGDDIDYLPELYKTSPAHYVDVVRALPDAYDRVMLVGHNPELEDYVSAVAGLPKVVPTAAIAEIVLPVDRWSEVYAETIGAVGHLWRPQELASSLPEGGQPA
jgi:phosphohistidine phosphatase